MTGKRYVIIGDGPAGVNAAEELRSRDAESKVFLIGQEPTLPYSPTILPYLFQEKLKRKTFFCGTRDISKNGTLI